MDQRTQFIADYLRQTLSMTAAASGNTAMLEGAICGTRRQARCQRRAPRPRGGGCQV